MVLMKTRASFKINGALGKQNSVLQCFWPSRNAVRMRQHLTSVYTHTWCFLVLSVKYFLS